VHVKIVFGIGNVMVVEIARRVMRIYARRGSSLPPQSHADVAVECQAARNSAVVLDQSYFGKIYLAGPDANKVPLHGSEKPWKGSRA
jgi:glycine cleavage system aminomethyltransferase T